MRKYIISVFFILSACSVGEEYDHSPFISDTEVKEVLHPQFNGQRITPTWYKIFNDDTLNQLIDTALTQNLSVKQGIERLHQSRLSFLSQSKQMYPMFDANGGYTYNKANNRQAITDDINAFKVGFDVSWELDIWGRGKYISDQYYELMMQNQYSLSDINVSVTAEIINNYIGLREAQEKLNIAKRNLSLQRDILQTVKDKYNAGIADDLALSQAEYAIETTKSTIPPLTTQTENYKNALAVLLGVPVNRLPVNLDNPRHNFTARTFLFKTKELYNLPLDVVRTRPDIIAAEAEIRAQNSVVNQAITSLYPTFNLGATFGFLSSSGHSLFNEKSQVYGYTPGISVPIWHWGQLTNNIELQKHIKEEYILNYNEAILTALMELKNTITAVEEAYKTNAYKKTSLNKMRTIMNLTQQKYENGLVDFTDVAQAEQNLLNAQNALISSNAEILSYINAFYKAAGGGYNFNRSTCTNESATR